jgi:hypothetical protein
MDVNATSVSARTSIRDNRSIDVLAGMSNRSIFLNAWSSCLEPSRGALNTLALFLVMVFLTTGCKTINVAEYKVSDSEIHREAVKEIVTSTATEFGLEDALQEPNPLGVHYIASYSHDFRVSRWPLRLSVAVVKDGLRTSLTQIKRGKRRTDKYLEIQNRLTTEFTNYLRSDVVIELYDGAYPLGL